jgi:hypothetical protein
MEPPRTNMFPCARREHNAQAPEKAPVTVARNRVFLKGRGKASSGDRSLPLRDRRRMLLARLQRVVTGGEGLQESMDNVEREGDSGTAPGLTQVRDQNGAADL